MRVGPSIGPVVAGGAVALQSDGKIVVAGWSEKGQHDMLVFRLDADGTIDSSSGIDGQATTASFSATRNDEALDVAVQTDGKIVVAGWADGKKAHDFAVERLLADGTLDTTFSGDGRVMFDFGFGTVTTGFNDEAKSVAIRADGKIVVAGRAYDGSNDDVGVARLLAGGSLDGAFGGDGLVTLSFGASTDSGEGVAAVANNRILVAASTFVTTSKVGLARLLPGGGLDSTFDGDWKRTIAFSAPSFCAGLVIQGDGKAVVLGGTGSMFAFARVSTSGGLDTSFSGDGKRTITPPAGLTDNPADVAIVSGKIVAAGSRRRDEPGPVDAIDFLAIRLLA